MPANIVGGLVFGVWMATARYCLGTIVAEAGEGRLDAWVAGSVGARRGMIAFGLLQLVVMLTLARVGLDRVTFASPWLVLLVFGPVVIAAAEPYRS
jgi:hypothetical protein